MSFDKLRTYILELEPKIIILNNKVNVVNYEKIEHFDNHKIIIKTSNKIIVINGSNLIITKLLKDELLIEGIIKGLELNEQN